MSDRQLVLLEEEFDIQEIRCFCIVGINPWERLERQAVNISLKLIGVGGQKGSSNIVGTYQSVVREVAEVGVCLLYPILPESC